jgi:hypothetical protein
VPDTPHDKLKVTARCEDHQGSAETCVNLSITEEKKSGACPECPLNEHLIQGGPETVDKVLAWKHKQSQREGRS